MREHLRAAYKEGAAADYGAGFIMKPTADNCTELAGEYIGLFFDQSNPHDCERQIAERIQIRRAALWGSMPFCVELDNLKDTDAHIHQPAAMLVAAD